MTVQEWLAGYARAWEERDAAAAAALFSEGSSYLDQPFGDAYRGRDGVSEYWSGVTATQERVAVRIGEPVVAADQRRAAAEFWVTMLNGGAEVTLTGILFLRFDADGLCEELREAWHFSEGRLEPTATWGS
ncbi:MAG TPA: nuclear transport factor 2 family protein [Solirubrobacteraceae bacterium]|nr:nuclear transport factor 2 family protein [Solirubrobacteraceae bacterium]